VASELILSLVATCFAAAGAFLYRRRLDASQSVPLEVPALLPKEPDRELARPGRALRAPAALVVEGPSGALVRLEPAEPSRHGAPVPRAVLVNLSTFLQHVPALANSGQQLLANTYRVVLKPELLEGLADGSFRMMDARGVAGGMRLNVVDRAGTIVGQGANVPVDKALQLASAGFQVATFVTGQVHLAQIHARLEEIQGTLSDVLAHLQEAQEGKLLGTMSYLRSLVVELQSHSLEPARLAVCQGQLETIERETLGVAHALVLELQRRERELDAVKLDERFATSKHDAEALRRALEHYEGAAKRYQLALWVRFAALQVQAYLPQPPLTLEARLTDVSTKVLAFDALNHRVHDRARERCLEVSGFFTRNRTLEERRQGVVKETYERLGPIHEAVDRLRELADMRLLLQASRAQAEREGIVLEVRNGTAGAWEAKLLTGGETS
jgi:hypothetical protein